MFKGGSLSSGLLFGRPLLPQPESLGARFVHTFSLLKSPSPSQVAILAEFEMVPGTHFPFSSFRKEQSLIPCPHHWWEWSYFSNALLYLSLSRACVRQMPSRHVTSRHVTSRHITSHHITSSLNCRQQITNFPSGSLEAYSL